MKFSHSTAILIVLLSFISTSIIAEPQSYSPLIQLTQSNNKNLNKAIQSIKQQTGGKVLSSKTVKIKGQIIYKIKVLLPSGKVQTFKVASD